MQTTHEQELFCVAEEEEGSRLDLLLAKRFPHLSRTYFQRLIEEGFVLINGERVKKRETPEEGDEIEICFQVTKELSLEPENIPLDILYEDPYLIAINKPPGMVVHPAPGHWSHTFVNALIYHCKNCPTPDPLRPGIVHRIDKDTSGVLIAAKTVEAHQALVSLFASRKIEKLYLCVCVGNPPNGLLSAPIGRNPAHRKEMTVLPDGKEAITHFSVAAFNQRLSLVVARPKTGRTHQIRVHLKHLKTPILGDELYGAMKTNLALGAPRQLLHAYRLTFAHPITGEPLHITAPIPEDMKGWMQQLCGPALCESLLPQAK